MLPATAPGSVAGWRDLGKAFTPANAPGAAGLRSTRARLCVMCLRRLGALVGVAPTILPVLTAAFTAASRRCRCGDAHELGFRADEIRCVGDDVLAT